MCVCVCACACVCVCVCVYLVVSVVLYCLFVYWGGGLPSFCTVGLSILRDKMMQLQNIHSESLRALLAEFPSISTRRLHINLADKWSFQRTVQVIQLEQAGFYRQAVLNAAARLTSFPHRVVGGDVGSVTQDKVTCGHKVVASHKHILARGPGDTCASNDSTLYERHAVTCICTNLPFVH